MEEDIEIKSIVIVKAVLTAPKVIGTVEFLGTTDFASGIWLGLSLIPECRRFAKNNGSVNGKKYFSSPSNDASTENLNFGLFVRPENVEILKISELVKLEFLNINTKFNLLLDSFQHLESKLLNVNERLEISFVETENLVSEKEGLIDKLNELVIENQVLKNSTNHHEDSDLQFVNGKLQLELAQLKEIFKQNETNYLEQISLLKRDIASLEKNIQSTESYQELINDLSNSENIIESLSLENSDLSFKIEDLSSRMSELENTIIYKEKLISELQSHESKNKDSISKLTETITMKDNEIALLKTSIDRYPKITTEKDHSPFDGFYVKLLLSLDASSNDYSDYLTVKLSKFDGDILRFMHLLMNLKRCAQTIQLHCKDEWSAECSRWSQLLFKLDFISGLLEFDRFNVLYDLYYLLIEKIYVLILNYIELNDEKNDGYLLLSMSLDLKIDIDFFLKLADNKFEKCLLIREIMIYLYNTENSEIDFTRLNELRMLNQGVEVTSIDIQCANDFKKIRIDDFKFVDLSWRSIFFEEKIQTSEFTPKETESVEAVVSNENIEELEDQLQHEEDKSEYVSSLERQIYDLTARQEEYSLKLSLSAQKENSLNDEITNLKSIMSRYNIHDLSQINEIELLEKSKLLNIIKNQRDLLFKASNKTEKIISQSDIKFLETFKSTKYNPMIHSASISKIDDLFDLCMVPISEKENNQSYYKQKILEFFDE